MSSAKRLIVEGEDDKFAVIELMKNNTVAWPKEDGTWPVKIEVGRGAEAILKTGYLTNWLKTPGVEIVGVLIDADDNFDGRWKQITQHGKLLFPNMASKLPSDGLIIENDDKMRFGVWIMPDNRSSGMLETFLQFLVPHDDPVLEHARNSLRVAKEKGAPWRKSHFDKGAIHTWLAWQDPPGQALGRALTKKILDPHHSSAAPFVDWFKRLYQL